MATFTWYYRGMKFSNQDAKLYAAGVRDVPRMVIKGAEIWGRAGRYLKITRKPDKMTYYYGDTLDLSGIEITLIDPETGTRRDVTADCVFNPADGGTVSGNFVNISYNDGGTILKTKLRLRVIIAIRVAVPPDHPVQETGATYDYTGVVIHAVFNDGGEEDITNQCIYNPAEHSAITAEDLIP